MTILNWSFPRKDLSRSAQAYQLALALREEVDDLQKAGCRVIQVRMPGHGLHPDAPCPCPTSHMKGRRELRLSSIADSVTGRPDTHAVHGLSRGLARRRWMSRRCARACP